VASVPTSVTADETSDELRLAGAKATFVLTRLAPGIVLLRATGRDTGQFGDAPFVWLEKEMGRHGAIEVFVDTREMSNATHEVAEGWSDWVSRHRARLKRMNLLTASKYVHMTLEVAKLFSRTGELMRIYTDAGAFAEAVGQSMGRPFVL
jgi:hypothetical protein